MKLIRATDYNDMSDKAAGIFAAQIKDKPDSVLGLATGSTVLGIYERLISLYKDGELTFSQVQSCNLDEYTGLSSDNEQSYRYYMYHKFFKNIDIKPENTHLPDGMAADLKNECERYNDLIEKTGGMDIQLLGLGNNGHIGFNEPGEVFIKETHVVKLNESTIRANARFFADEKQVPRKAITMGMGNIMRAKKIILCVSGSAKAEILSKVLRGDVTPQVPASVLHFHHDCTVIADEAVLS